MTRPASERETVRIHVIIEIDVDTVEDTGLTVEQWNALHDSGRAEIVDQLWSAAAEANQGGMQVVTPGAVGI